MTAHWKSAGCWLFVSLLGFIAPACDQAAEPPMRLPNQVYNRMVYVRTGTDAEVFVDMPGHWDVGSPSISPDGKWIAFDALTIGEDPERETWLIGVDGKGLRKLFNGNTPRWSPDGKRLLCSRNIKPVFLNVREMIQFEIATGKVTPIRAGRYPDWSPDGKRMAFSLRGELTDNSGMHPGAKLWTANLDGTAAAELCDGDWPSWSPDGKKIAYCLQAEGKPSEMWVIDLDTKERALIGHGYFRAQWTADSKGFVCSGLFAIPGEKSYRRVPARFSLDKPLKPSYFGTDLDNPWSPCISRDGKTMVVIVDSQKRRGDDDR